MVSFELAVRYSVTISWHMHGNFSMCRCNIYFPMNKIWIFAERTQSCDMRGVQSFSRWFLFCGSEFCIARIFFHSYGHVWLFEVGWVWHFPFFARFQKNVSDKPASNCGFLQESVVPWTLYILHKHFLARDVLISREVTDLNLSTKNMDKKSKISSSLAENLILQRVQ